MRSTSITRIGGSRSEVDAIIADSPHVERGGHISVRRVVADE
jgi:hypothetical protein